MFLEMSSRDIASSLYQLDLEVCMPYHDEIDATSDLCKNRELPLDYIFSYLAVKATWRA